MEDPQLVTDLKLAGVAAIYGVDLGRFLHEPEHIAEDVEERA